MGIIKDFKEFRNEKKQNKSMTIEDLLLQAGLISDEIGKYEALNIPAVSGCMELIANTIAMIPIKLYKEENGAVIEVDDDRVRLLNDDTGDTLDGFQWKKSMIYDYLLCGNGYSYINRKGNKVESIHYVKENNVSIQEVTDPIFKSYKILVNGQQYEDFEFIKILRKTSNGAFGTGIIEESQEILATAYNALKYENILVKTGGNKKGFLKSQNRLSPEAITELRTQWNNMYKNNTENCIVLNNGLEFHEASSTSVEMQLNENKKTNSNEICKLFSVPNSILDGTASESDYNNYIRSAIMPPLKALETSLNKDFLLHTEQKSYFFAADTKELLKGDIEKRYKAYEIGSKNGFLMTDDIRYMEDLKPLGLEFIKLGLSDVLYNPKTKEIYTPNTGQTAQIDDLKGGENNEGGNTE